MDLFNRKKVKELQETINRQINNNNILNDKNVKISKENVDYQYQIAELKIQLEDLKLYTLQDGETIIALKEKIDKKDETIKSLKKELKEYKDGSKISCGGVCIDDLHYNFIPNDDVSDLIDDNIVKECIKKQKNTHKNNKKAKDKEAI